MTTTMMMRLADKRASSGLLHQKKKSCFLLAAEALHLLSQKCSSLLKARSPPANFVHLFFSRVEERKKTM